MHQIVLLTALSATTGLFGGGRQCRTGYCGSSVTRPAYYAPVSTCRTGTCPRTYAAAPVAAPQAAPAAAPPQTAYAQPRRVASYYSYYYPTQSTCPGGNCPRR
jgi:hypothetical protein